MIEVGAYSVGPATEHAMDFIDERQAIDFITVHNDKVFRVERGKVQNWEDDTVKNYPNYQCVEKNKDGNAEICAEPSQKDSQDTQSFDVAANNRKY
jgi:hypothetical protein